MPIFLFFNTFVYEFITIQQGDFIVLTEYSESGGFGDGGSFAYVINDKFCKEISIGTTYFNSENILEKIYKNKFIDPTQNLDYEILFDEKSNYFTIIKDGKKIHKKKIKDKYFNIHKSKILLNKEK